MTAPPIEVSHHFHPQGVTALGLIAESHVAIHTWPEYRYAAIDVFTCGRRANAEKACRYLISALKAERHSLKTLTRGSEVALPRQHGSEPRDPVPAGAPD